MTNCHWQNNNSQPGWIVIRTRLKGENGLTRLKGEDGLLFIRTTTKGRALLWSGSRVRVEEQEPKSYNLKKIVFKRFFDK